MSKRVSINTQRIVDCFDIEKLISTIENGDWFARDPNDWQEEMVIDILGSGAAGIYQTGEVCSDFGIVFPKNFSHAYIYGEDDTLFGNALDCEFWDWYCEPLFDNAADILTEKIKSYFGFSLSLFFAWLEGDGSFYFGAIRDIDIANGQPVDSIE